MNKPLLLAWVAALIATIGSLYFSEVLHYIPCTLCWYQRIFMYPLAIILGMAFYRNDNDIAKYTLPLSIIGMLISGYHINWLGFITIPILAFTAFTIITICLVFIARNQKK
jgi:disulfide bond formation protein DsbB